MARIRPTSGFESSGNDSGTTGSGASTTDNTPDPDPITIPDEITGGDGSDSTDGGNDSGSSDGGGSDTGGGGFELPTDTIPNPPAPDDTGIDDGTNDSGGSGRGGPSGGSGDGTPDPDPITIPDEVSSGGNGSGTSSSNSSRSDSTGGSGGSRDSGIGADSGLNYSDRVPGEDEMTTGPAPGDTGQNNAALRAAAAEQVQERFAADLSRGDDFNIAVSNDDQVSLRLTDQGRDRLAESQQDFQAGIAAAAEGITDNQMQLDARDFLPSRFESIEQQIEEQNPGAEAGEDFTVSINESGEFDVTPTGQQSTSGTEPATGAPTTIRNEVTTGAESESVLSPGEFGAQPTQESGREDATTSTADRVSAADAASGAGGAVQTAGNVFNVAAGIGDFLAGDVDEAIGRQTSDLTVDPAVAAEFTDDGLLNPNEGKGGSVISQITGVTEADLQQLSEDFRTINEQYTVDLETVAAGGTPVATVPLLVEEENPESDSSGEVIQETALNTVSNVGAAAQGVEDITELADPRNLPMVFRNPGTVGASAAAAADERVTAAERYGRENPLKFATATTVGLAGAAAGGASAARSAGAAGGVRAALKAEIDPRIGAFGTTAETKLTRRIRNAVDDFQNDQRGQAQLIGGLDSDSTGNRDTIQSGGESTGVDADSNTVDFEPSRDYELEGGVQAQARQNLADQFEADIDNTRGTFDGDSDPFGRSDGPTFDPESEVPDADEVFDFDSTPEGDVDINDIPGVRDRIDAADAIGVTVGSATAERAGSIATSRVDADTTNATGGFDADTDAVGDLDTDVDTTLDVDQNLDVSTDTGTDFDRGFDIDRDIDTTDPGTSDFDFADTDTRNRDRDPTDPDPNPRDVDVAFEEQRVDEEQLLEEAVTFDEERFGTGFFTGESGDGGGDPLAGLDEFL